MSSMSDIAKDVRSGFSQTDPTMSILEYTLKEALEGTTGLAFTLCGRVAGENPIIYSGNETDLCLRCETLEESDKSSEYIRDEDISEKKDSKHTQSESEFSSSIDHTHLWDHYKKEVFEHIRSAVIDFKDKRQDMEYTGRHSKLEAYTDKYYLLMQITCLSCQRSNHPQTITGDLCGSAGISQHIQGTDSQVKDEDIRDNIGD